MQVRRFAFGEEKYAHTIDFYMLRALGASTHSDYIQPLGEIGKRFNEMDANVGMCLP